MKIVETISKIFHNLRSISYLGWDLGTYSLKVAEVTSYENKILLKGFAQAKTFENTIINQIITDEQHLKANLKNLLLNFHPETTNAHLSIPYEITIYGKFSIPHLTSNEMIEKQINDEIPYKLEDVYYSYFIIPEQAMYKVYYLVSKKENIEKIKNVFLDLNIKLLSIDADFVTLHNFLEFLYGPEDRVIIDWGNEKVKLYFSNKETPIYIRELFNLGFKDFKKNLQRDLKLTSDTIDKYIHSPPEDQTRNKIKDAYKEYIKKITEEIKYGIEIVRSKYDLNPKVFYLIGGGAKIPNIHKIFSELLKSEVNEIRIENKLKISEHIDKNYLRDINSQGVLAIATAVKEFI
ncbi:MAG: pilus assembly protein PilM [Caldimicrobium sp.]|nr:pilus assembly protein PilM [Caldimicrobium sp.]MCX7872826.1 pilus assembly protein PilM [Caldimicrobium sp.]MDW8093595.1 pilus assembly protein PilM [Caldimicrobium sp.]